MSSIRSLSFEHSRSGTGCWASFIYREGVWTFRLSAGEPEADGTDDYVIEVEPNGARVPVPVLARALDVLDPFTTYDLAYKGRGQCVHLQVDLNGSEVIG
jgi:hypothetical protein